MSTFDEHFCARVGASDFFLDLIGAALAAVLTDAIAVELGGVGTLVFRAKRNLTGKDTRTGEPIRLTVFKSVAFEPSTPSRTSRLLCEVLARLAETSLDEATLVLDAFTESVERALDETSVALVKEIGCFAARSRPEREGRDEEGRIVRLPATRTVGFVADPTLLARIEAG